MIHASVNEIEYPEDKQSAILLLAFKYGFNLLWQGKIFVYNYIQARQKNPYEIFLPRSIILWI